MKRKDSDQTLPAESELRGPVDAAGFESAVVSLLTSSGLDPAHPDVKDTPRRVSELWQREFLSGYEMDPAEILGSPLEGEEDPDTVIVRGLSFHSMCPHHLLPFQGVAHLAYVPRGKLVGFGRLGKLVACYTQRLTLQERATKQIANALCEHLGAAAAGCVLEAQQLCLGIPHDRHAGNSIITSAFCGGGALRSELRRQLLDLPHRG
jgi:GTP cyclohydrolase I